MAGCGVLADGAAAGGGVLLGLCLAALHEVVAVGVGISDCVAFSCGDDGVGSPGGLQCCLDVESSRPKVRGGAAAVGGRPCAGLGTGVPGVWGGVPLRRVLAGGVVGRGVSVAAAGPLACWVLSGVAGSGCRGGRSASGWRRRSSVAALGTRWWSSSVAAHQRRHASSTSVSCSRYAPTSWASAPSCSASCRARRRSSWSVTASARCHACKAAAR